MRECAGKRDYCKSKTIGKVSTKPNFCKVCKGNLCNFGHTFIGGIKIILASWSALLIIRSI